MTAPTSPDDWPLLDFLLQLRTDQARGAVRPLRDYLAIAPDCELDVAREFVRARGEQAGALGGDGIDGFVIQAELGRGGEGVVYRARDPLLERDVALKVLERRPDDLAEARTLRAAAAAARLDHPALARVFGAGRHEGRLWIAASYVAGHSLAVELERRRAADDPLPQRDLARLLAPIARGLQHAHERGVVHRDVKPGNLILRVDGSAVLADFGLARDDATARDLTVSGELRGTPAYLAPEQLRRSAASGSAVDVYALGVVALECALLRHPFEDVSPAATLARIERVEVWATPGFARLGRDLRAVLTMATAKEPARRYASAAALADDLERLAAGAPVRARAPGIVRRMWSWSRHNRALAASLLAFATTFGLGFLMLADSYVRERELRRQAWQRAERTRAVACAILFDRSRSLGQAATVATRVGMVRDAAQALDALAEDAPDDLQLRREQCLAWLRLAELHVPAVGPSLGDRDRARSCLDRAEAIARGVLRAEPRTPALLATIWVRRAVLVTDPDVAAAHYRRALACTGATDREARSARGTAMAMLAQLARDDGDVASAREWIDAAQREFRADIDDPDSRLNLLRANITAATILAQGGEPEVAVQLLGSIGEQIGSLGDAPGPARVRPQYERVFGNCLLLLGDGERARRRFDRAVGLARELLAEDETDQSAAIQLVDMLRSRAGGRHAAGDGTGAVADTVEADALASRFGFAARVREQREANRPGR